MEDPEMVELQNHRAMIELPENAVEAELKCKVFVCGKLIDVSRILDISDLREAFRKADDGYVDDDDTFVITEKGRRWLEEMDKK